MLRGDLTISSTGSGDATALTIDVRPGATSPAIILGGDFHSVEDISGPFQTRRGVVIYSWAGAVSASWDVLTPSSSEEVRSVLIDSTGDIFWVGGEYTSPPTGKSNDLDTYP